MCGSSKASVSPTEPDLLCCAGCGTLFTDDEDEGPGYDDDALFADDEDSDNEGDCEDDGQPSEQQENEDFAHDNDYDYETGYCDE